MKVSAAYARTVTESSTLAAGVDPAGGFLYAASRPGMAEWVDASDSKAGIGNHVRVRVPRPAPSQGRIAL